MECLGDLISVNSSFSFVSVKVQLNFNVYFLCNVFTTSHDPKIQLKRKYKHIKSLKANIIIFFLQKTIETTNCLSCVWAKQLRLYKQGEIVLSPYLKQGFE